MTDRRTFIVVVASALAALPSAVNGQSAGRTYRLGVLSPGWLEPLQPLWYSVPLGEMGYVEGRNLHIERRYAEGKFERVPEFARELASHGLDVILAVGSVAVQAAKDATRTVPIVMLLNGDPVAAGFVHSLARPGANVTGVLITPEGSLAGKRLELLKEAVPRTTRIALLAPDDPGRSWSQQLLETQTAAASLGLGLEVIVVRRRDYPRAFAAIAALRPQALVVGAASAFVRDRKEIIELAAKYRLPAIYEWPRQVHEGGLMSYGASDLETYRQVASYIDRLF